MIGGVVAAILGPLLTIVARDIPGLLALPVFISLWRDWGFCLHLTWLCSRTFKKTSLPGLPGDPESIANQPGVNETSGLSYGLVSSGYWLLRHAFSDDGGPSPLLTTTR
jgi:hypothetical protein